MFITFEGIDGSGKSTQIQLLKEHLLKQNHTVEVFREPGGTHVSEKVRDLLLNTESDIHPVSELLLFSAARAQLVSEKILPNLEKGIVVILDRFYDSTIAYQGYGRHSVPLKEIEKINEIATQKLVPDLTFYLKVSLGEAQKRTKLMAGDRMERSGEEFYRKVINGFNALAAKVDRIKTIDTTQTIQQSHKQILEITAQFISV